MQLLLKTQTDFNDLEDDDPQVGRLEHNFEPSRFLDYRCCTVIMFSFWSRSPT